MSRAPIAKRFVGAEHCSKYGDNKLCVRGGKYGFIGELHPKSGRGAPLPVPTGDARTPEQAIRAARKFLNGVHGKNN